MPFALADHALCKRDTLVHVLLSYWRVNSRRAFSIRDGALEDEAIDWLALEPFRVGGICNAVLASQISPLPVLAFTPDA